MRFNRSSALNIGMFTYQYILLFSKNPQFVFENKIEHWDLGVDYLIRIEDIITELPEIFKKYIFELTEEQKDALIKMKKLNTSSRGDKHKMFRITKSF